MTDPRLLEWARLPGPAKVLAAARQRLEAGHGMAGRPLQVSLTDSERKEVGRLLGTSGMLSGRQVGAKALADATRSLGTELETLLAAGGGPVRNRPAEKAASRRHAEDERARAAAVLAASARCSRQVQTWSPNFSAGVSWPNRSRSNC